jgi:hypothetical protein
MKEIKDNFSSFLILDNIETTKQILFKIKQIKIISLKLNCLTKLISYTIHNPLKVKS